MFLQRAILPLIGILFALLISEARGWNVKNKLKMVESWKHLEFVYSSKGERDKAIERKELILGNPIPFEIAIFYNKISDEPKPRIFLSIPRRGEGIPVTLGYVTKHRTPEGNALVQPYPDWPSQRVDNCDNLISVWGIQNDRCGRLWVVDSGQIDGIQVCPPKLLSYSLMTDKLLSSYRFKRDDYYFYSLFIKLSVDVRGDKCEDTFVYIADAEGYGIVVYDHQNMKSWRIDNKLCYPYQEGGTFSIAGYEFDFMRGIAAMALSPPAPNGDKTLYFHSRSSLVESYVLTSVIRNRTIFEGDRGACPRSFMSFKGKRSSQSAAEAMGRYGMMFFDLMTETQIACWNSNKDAYDQKNFEIIVSDPENLQYTTGLILIPKKDGSRELWTLSTSMQRYISGKISLKEINFRIQMGVVEDLVRGTRCAPSN